MITATTAKTYLHCFLYPLNALHTLSPLICPTTLWGRYYFLSFFKRALEKEMATHSSILAWKSPWTEVSGGLQSMGLHDWACVHEGGGWWVGSNKLVELKNNNNKFKKKKHCSLCRYVKLSLKHYTRLMIFKIELNLRYKCCSTFSFNWRVTLRSL